MNGPRIVVIDDAPRIRHFLEIELSHAGFQVRCAPDGAIGFDLVRELQPDLIVLDIMMPHLDGLTLLPLLRRVTQAPIVIISAKSGSADKILGLRNGADFYLAKPFEMPELLSLVNVALRRPILGKIDFLAFHDIKINAHERTVERAGMPIHLTTREFDLLATLLREPRRVFSREELLERIWGEKDAGLGVVDTFISLLRGKVDRPFSEPLIHNVRGAGYCVRREIDTSVRRNRSRREQRNTRGEVLKGLIQG